MLAAVGAVPAGPLRAALTCRARSLDEGQLSWQPAHADIPASESTWRT